MNLMRYLLEANLYLAAFYLLYLFLLRKETYYQLSRAYLLASSVLAFIIPLLQLGILKPETFTTVSVSPAFDPREFQSLPVVAAPIPVHAWSVFDYCLLVYGIITAVLLINLGIKIFKLIRLSKQNARQANGEFILIEIDSESAAFSFFSYLFIDTKLASSQTIIRHEEVHIRQKHSWDIIYTELLKVINWFNPFVYLMQNSLKEIHEFIADHYTAQLENNERYTDFLISNAYGSRANVLTNSFSTKSMLRKRIVMLYRERSGRAAKLKYLLALPLICGLLCLSTMAFTDKNYGFDILPQHVQAKLKQARLKLNKVIFKQDTVATLEGDDTTKKEEQTITAMVLNKPDTLLDTVKTQKGPLIIINGRILPQSDKIALDDKNKLGDKISGLADIDPADIKSISILKDAASTAIYGKAGANGVILITTNDYARGRLDAMNGDIKNAIKREIDVAAKRAITDSNTVFTAVEVEPIPKGGMDAFYKFLGSTIRYPAEDRKNSTQGRVIAQFIVEKDGSLSNIKIMRAPSPTLGEEAVRVLNLSPRWTPGVQNGRPVRVQFTIPVNFALETKAPSSVIMGRDEIFTAVEVEPTPKEGLDGFYKFLGNNIKYPAEDKKNNIQGRVIVQFIVEKDGSFSDIKILRQPSEGLGNEALRVLSLAPKWNPGIQNGRTVRVQYTIPINFSLGNR